MTEFPKAITPEEFAKHYGWSPRKVREIARDIGACRIVGNRMLLLQQDVDAILEASKPKPKAKPAYQQFANPTLAGLADMNYETLKKMRDEPALMEKPKRSRAKAFEAVNSTQAALDYLGRRIRKHKESK